MFNYPASCMVHVFDGDRPICRERCHDAKEAAAVAERLYASYNGPRRSRVK